MTTKTDKRLNVRLLSDGKEYLNDKGVMINAIVRPVCVECKVQSNIAVNVHDLMDFASGMKLIQNALPYLTAGQRELMLSGLCPQCWDKIMLDFDPSGRSDDDLDDEEDNYEEEVD